jgi:2-keto-4-pentenoate hydratase/2-oxohepta-3-ene-1,7-dioic acid hydratase in catechol pathway
MKLLRVGPAGREKPALLDEDGVIRDLSSVVGDISGGVLAESELQKLSQLDSSQLPKVPNSERIGPCVGNVGKIICIGLNYTDHAEETGSRVPREPIIFAKATSAICGPNDDVVIPRGSTKTDWEVELAVVIGKTAKYVTEDDALDFVAGYCVLNDVSERAYQLERKGQWSKGKSCDTFAPIGPWLVTKDEVGDPQQLNLWLEVDGHRYQDGNTKNMAYSVAFLVSYLSQFCSLHPGDIIATGTPAGVGMGVKPEPVFLRPGQTMHLGVDKLGMQTQTMVADS